MIRCVVLSFVLLSTFVSNASADIAPPPGHKRIDPRVRFLGIEKHDGYVFFLSYTAGNNPRFQQRVNLPVASDAEFVLSGKPLSEMRLIAVTRQDFAKLEKDKLALARLEQHPGVLMAALPVPSNTAYTFDPSPPLSEYRVSIEGGHLFVDKVASLRGWAIGLLCGVSLAGLGIWFARRRRSQPKVPVISPEGEESHVA